MLTTDGRDVGIAGLSLIIVGGVVRAYMHRVKVEPIKEPEPGRLRALEIKLERTSEGVIKAEAAVVDLEKLIEARSAAIDEKMEIMLAEMKRLSDTTDERHSENREDWAKLWGSFNEAYRLVTERLARMETNISNLDKIVEKILDRYDRERTRGGGSGL